MGHLVFHLQLGNKNYDWSIIRMSHVLGQAVMNINMDVLHHWNITCSN